jgi:hypothetical protein
MRPKYLAAAILFLVILLPPPSNRSQQQQPANSEQRNAVSTVAKDTNGSNSETNTTTNKTKDGPQKPPLWDVTWATWALVVLGGVAALIALCTLSDIRKQTKNTEIAALASQKNAEAAFQNTIAIVNAERAWVDLMLVTTQEGTHQLRAINHGKTPARIKEYEIGISTFTPLRPVLPVELPRPLLSAALNIFLGASEPQPRILDTLDIRAYFGREWEEVKAGNKAALFQVVIRYKHIVMKEEMRESKFVFMYGPFDTDWTPLPEYTDYS